jgi:hypothetical protein
VVSAGLSLATLLPEATQNANLVGFGGMNGGEQEKWCHYSQLTGSHVWTTILEHVGCKLQASGRLEPVGLRRTG